MATRTENQVDLIVSDKEPLRMSGRREPPKYLLPFSRWLMRDFDGIIQAFMGPMIRIWRKVLYWLDVTAQLVRHDDAWLTELPQQSGEKALGCLGVTAGLNQNIKNIAVRINCPPKPKLLSADRDDDLIEVPLVIRLWSVFANTMVSVR